MKNLKNLLFTITMLVSAQAAVAMERPLAPADVQALHDAVKARNYTLVEQLVTEKGVPVDAQNAQGETPLLNYIKNVCSSDMSPCRVRVTPRAWKDRIEYFSDECKGLLSIVPKEQERPFTKELHDYLTFTSDERPLTGFSRITVLEDGSRVKKDVRANEEHYCGNTEYMDEVLLKLGAKPNIADNDGLTPLVAACKKGLTKKIKKLLVAGARPNIGGGLAEKTPDGRAIFFPYWIRSRQKAIGFAIVNADVDAVRALIASGAYIDRMCYLGLNPLATAVRCYECCHEFETQEQKHREEKYAEIIDILLQANASPNSKDALGRSVLHWAAFYQRKDLVARLLAAGAKPLAKNYKGETPHDLACQDYCVDFAHFGPYEPISKEERASRHKIKQDIKQMLKPAQEVNQLKFQDQLLLSLQDSFQRQMNEDQELNTLLSRIVN